mmetsp:Transcript_47211/g.86669  ORF Transcript_47211/g.86669 Transcript_47211/m.86669 type:complete len:213 (+) Transcript_47211:1269-1907(+)
MPKWSKTCKEMSPKLVMMPTCNGLQVLDDASCLWSFRTSLTLVMGGAFGVASSTSFGFTSATPNSSKIFSFEPFLYKTKFACCDVEKTMHTSSGQTMVPALRPCTAWLTEKMLFLSSTLASPRATISDASKPRRKVCSTDHGKVAAWLCCSPMPVFSCRRGTVGGDAMGDEIDAAGLGCSKAAAGGVLFPEGCTKDKVGGLCSGVPPSLPCG